MGGDVRFYPQFVRFTPGADILSGASEGPLLTRLGHSDSIARCAVSSVRATVASHKSKDSFQNFSVAYRVVT